MLSLMLIAIPTTSTTTPTGARTAAVSALRRATVLSASSRAPALMSMWRKHTKPLAASSGLVEVAVAGSVLVTRLLVMVIVEEMVSEPEM